MVGAGVGGGPADRQLKLSLADTLRLAWADPELRSRLKFVLYVFAAFAVGTKVPVPIPGLDPAELAPLIEQSPIFAMINQFGGGALGALSVFSLGLMPYITASIIMQVLTMGIPQWKKELQEGGEYARRQQNKRTRILTLFLCFFQSMGLITVLNQAIGTNFTVFQSAMIGAFWTAGAMILLWLGEQISEKGIGNGVSLLIFAGIVISVPNLVQIVGDALQVGTINWLQVIAILLVFIATTVFVVFFTVAQRRIPIQHMRRNYGTQAIGGKTSYLPISVNMAGVIPIIFAVSLIYLPGQFALMLQGTALEEPVQTVADFLYPNFSSWEGLVGVLIYTGMIFFFTYFWNAMMYNVEDIANNLKRGGSYIPGIRPGKQTREFLNDVISRVTFVGALFLSIAALTQYIFPVIAPIQNLGLLGGTSLLIMVSVALDTMRQIESNLLVKKYGG